MSRTYFKRMLTTDFLFTLFLLVHQVTAEPGLLPLHLGNEFYQFPAWGWNGRNSFVGLEINIDDERDGISPHTNEYLLAEELTLDPKVYGSDFETSINGAISGLLFFPNATTGHPRNFVVWTPRVQGKVAESSCLIPLKEVTEAGGSLSSKERKVLHTRIKESSILFCNAGNLSQTDLDNLPPIKTSKPLALSTTRQRKKHVDEVYDTATKEVEAAAEAEVVKVNKLRQAKLDVARKAELEAAQAKRQKPKLKPKKLAPAPASKALKAPKRNPPNANAKKGAVLILVIA